MQNSTAPLQTAAPQQSATQQPSAIATTPPEPIVFTADPRTTISDTVSGEAGLTSATRFTATTVEAGAKLSVRLGSIDSTRLFRVRNDQFGQTELIDQGLTVSDEKKGIVEVAIPDIGRNEYKVAGKELPLSVENLTLESLSPDAQSYRTQSLACPGWQDKITVMVGGDGGYPAEVYQRTQDTTYPVKIDVYLHGGLGSDKKSEEYSLSRWRDYNLNDSPDKDRLAQNIREYRIDPWDTGKEPAIGADLYISRRRGCGDSGRPWLDVCHSAGCNKVVLALLRSWPDDSFNNAGILAVTPAFGGSILGIKELVDATIAMGDFPKRMIYAYYFSLMDLGALLKDPGRHLKEFLVGKSRDLFGEGIHAVAWNGKGPGIPTITYQWFSLWDISVPFLSARVSPNDRYAMPVESSIRDYAPTIYADPRTGKAYYNYSEAIQGTWDAQINRPSFPGSGSVDVVAGYMAGDIGGPSRKFQERFSETGIVETFRNRVQLEKDPKFQEEAMSFLNFVIAKSPSNEPNKDAPNQNAPNDGTLTILQQIGAVDGPSILAQGSTYANLKINDEAVHARTPQYIRKVEIVPGINHALAVLGTPKIWDTLNRWLFERVERVRDEEAHTILTDDEKRIIQGILIPKDGLGSAYLDYDIVIGRHRHYNTYQFYGLSSIVFTQDPLKTGQSNRVRMTGSGTLAVTYGTWDTTIHQYLNHFAGVPWSVNRDFIRRSGVWHLVVE